MRPEGYVPDPDFPSMCLQLLEYAKRYQNVSSVMAAWKLIKILRSGMDLAAPRLSP